MKKKVQPPTLAISFINEQLCQEKNNVLIKIIPDEVIQQVIHRLAKQQ